MPKPKLCTDCGVLPKKAGHPRWCVECWLSRQPVTMRVTYTQRRLQAVPEPLRRARVVERDWPPGRRWCAGCQAFVRLQDSTGGRCKTCASQGAHASRLKATYAVHGRPFTDADYAALLELQGGRCYLCHKLSPSRRLAVDHDHLTGEVRGLLCPSPEYGCNLKVVPMFDASPDPLAMVERLRQYLAGNTPAAMLPR
jgi:hypothetical protein